MLTLTVNSISINCMSRKIKKAEYTSSLNLTDIECISLLSHTLEEAELLSQITTTRLMYQLLVLIQFQAPWFGLPATVLINMADYAGT